MSKLYEAHIRVDKNFGPSFNSYEQRLKAIGVVGVRCKFEIDCIHCYGYIPLDKLQEVKYIEGVIDVALLSSDGESD
jgi:hypothetical protein